MSSNTVSKSATAAGASQHTQEATTSTVAPPPPPQHTSTASAPNPSPFAGLGLDRPYVSLFGGGPGSERPTTIFTSQAPSSATGEGAGQARPALPKAPARPSTFPKQSADTKTPFQPGNSGLSAASTVRPVKKLRTEANSGLDVTSEPLKIIVGRDNHIRTFYPHEGVIKRHSDLIATAVRDNWKEGEDRTVRLPDEDPACFEVFHRFIYSSGVIHILRKKEDNTADQDHDDEWARLAQCWCLGDKLQSPSFKDCILDAMVQKMHLGLDVPKALHEVVYAKTAKGANGLKRLAVDIATWKWSAAAFDQAAMDASWCDFFRDLAVRLGKLGALERTGPEPWNSADKCFYHEHGAEKPCYRAIFD